MSFLDRLGERAEIVISPIALLALLGCGRPGDSQQAEVPPRTPRPLEPFSVSPPDSADDAVGMPQISPVRLGGSNRRVRRKGPPVPGLRGEFAVLPEGVPPGYMTERSVAASLVRTAPKVDFAGVRNGFAGSPLRENFCVRWSGFLHVARAGRHVFYLSSDDGSRLYIDEHLVVENDGQHGPQEREGAIELEQGHHAVRLEFFQGGGEAACRLQWQPAGKERQALEGHSIWHYSELKSVAGSPQF